MGSTGAVKSSGLPRRLYMEDIKVSRDTIRSDVLDLYTRERFTFKSGSEIRQVHAFAGKGCLKPFEKAAKYAQRYPSGGSASEWQHCSGIAQITDGKETFTAEVHWVQGKDKLIREAFIKEYR